MTADRGPPGRRRAAAREPELRPPPSRPAVAGLGPVTRLVLPNGLTVLVRENRGAPVVAPTLLSRGGSAEEAPELNGLTALLGRVLLKGTRARSALDVASAAEDAGGGIESGADQEYGELRAWGLARHWPRLLALLHEVATEPRFADDEIERERARAAGADPRPRGPAGAGRQPHPRRVALRPARIRLADERGGGDRRADHPGEPARPVRGDLRRRPPRPRRVRAPSPPTTCSTRRGGSSRGSGRARRPPRRPPPPDRPVRLREHETSPTQQAHVLLGYLAPSVPAPDHVALKVANGVLGGGMSSRLFRTLRDEEGLAYSVGSAYPTRRGAGRVVLHIGTAPENVAAAEAGLRREVERLAGEPVSRGRARAHQGLPVGVLRPGPPDERASELLPGFLRGDGRRRRVRDALSEPPRGGRRDRRAARRAPPSGRAGGGGGRPGLRAGGRGAAAQGQRPDQLVPGGLGRPDRRQRGDLPLRVLSLVRSGRGPASRRWARSSTSSSSSSSA